MSKEDDSEPILMQPWAGRMAGGGNLMGGRLVLTDQRLLFIPVINRSGLKLSTKAAKLNKSLHDWQFSPQQLLNIAIMPLTKPVEIRLDQIQEAVATRRCALRISWSDQLKSRTMEFNFFAKGFFGVIWDPRNVSCRDDMLAAINEALQT